MNSLNLPPIIFGTSGLGNLFVAHNEDSKFEIVKECFRLATDTVVFDSAGKYGAGLSLEVLGRSLDKLNIDPSQVIISNKLGWLQTALTTPEPTFEPGVWMDLKNDAVQQISYDGIIACFEQGNDLLSGYIPQMVSVHDPDEYLANAQSQEHFQELYHHILEAYRALHELKKQGKVKAIGIGAKDWKIIQQIAKDVSLDWVMFANSMTILSHPTELLNFIEILHQANITVINSAVFHSGFLVGSNYFDYKLLNQNDLDTKHLFDWRDKFFQICTTHGVSPAAACVQFALNVKGVSSIALNTTLASRVEENMNFVNQKISSDFWGNLYQEKLIAIL